jgi:thiamine-monophosphate kinase
VDEFELIQRYFVRPDEVASVITGIGDDGAVLRPPKGKDLVTVVDTLVEGVHFPHDINAADLGYRAVAVNLSDIAAMGGRPRWMTLALTMTESNESWLSSFASGLHDAAAEHGVVLVGGDMTQGDIIVASVQITGDVAAGSALLRSGASVGETIYVSGTVGDAAAGLDLMSAGTPNEYLSARFSRPTARVALGQSLVGRVSAAIDVSDGLYADLGKLLSASGVGAKLDLDNLPISTALKACCDKEQQRKFALSGGDDYELCFTSAGELPAQAGGVAVTAIGTVTDGNKLVCRDRSGIVDYEDSGYLHFQ